MFFFILGIQKPQANLCGFFFSCCSYEETKEELEEFQTSSRELEQELETQLRQEEKKTKELASANERLQHECDSLKVNRALVLLAHQLVRCKDA